MVLTRILGIVVLAVAAISCTDDRVIADRAVALFHEQFNAGRFDVIYTSAADEFRAATRQDDWIALLSAVRRKAGAFESTSQTSWLVNTGTIGTTVTATYKTKFEKLSTNEHFTWRISEAKGILLGYRIDAPDLGTN